MTRLSPQRTLREAVRLLELARFDNEELDQDVLYNIEELNNISKALYRDGISSIEEYKGN